MRYITRWHLVWRHVARWISGCYNGTLQSCNSVSCVYIWLVTCLSVSTSSNGSPHCCENFIVHLCKEYLMSWRIRIGTVGTLLVTLVSNNNFDNYSWHRNIDLRASLEHGNGYKSLDKLYFYVSRHGRNGRIDNFKLLKKVFYRSFFSFFYILRYNTTQFLIFHSYLSTIFYIHSKLIKRVCKFSRRVHFSQSELSVIWFNIQRWWIGAQEDTYFF